MEVVRELGRALGTALGFDPQTAPIPVGPRDRIIYPRRGGGLTEAQAGPNRRASLLNETISQHMNYVRTTKYTLATWMPLSLFTQFKRFANVYFLLITILTWQSFSPKNPISQTGTFSMILLFTMLKEGYEDYLRNRQDTEENNRPTVVWDWATRKWKDAVWESVRVGDIVVVKKDGAFPADLVALLSSHTEGTCYIDTANLDGETNLKNKKAPTELQKFFTENRMAKQQHDQQIATRRATAVNLPDLETLQDVREKIAQVTHDESDDDSFAFSYEDLFVTRSLQAIDFQMRIEPPHANVASFNGSCVLVPRDDDALGVGHQLESIGAVRPHNAVEFPLMADNVLFRGCILRNTGWVVGLVVYAGSETKIRMNAREAPTKVSKVQQTMNMLLRAIFLTLISICFVFALCSAFFEGAVFGNPWYMNYPEQGGFFGTLWFIFTKVLTFIVAYSHLIPISLYVALEMLKLTLTRWIANDRTMVDPSTGITAQARTSDLIEELGQAEFIFSDKTGTLTSNTMEFVRCSISNKVYGPSQEAAAAYRSAKKNTRGICGDMQVVRELKQRTDKKQAEALKRFFTHMAVCHTVIPDKPTVGEDGQESIAYQGSSPDEVSLVEAAARVGVRLVKKRHNTVWVDVLGVLEVFEVKNVLEFTSDRKRMSVIVEHDKQLFCLTKGADSIMMPLMRKNLSDATLEHLTIFSKEGLRTLVLASKRVDREWYNKWAAEYNEAECALVNREEKVAVVAAKMELQLEYVGCSAVEDRLQDGVPETIALLKDAGMKVWVLTGDKLETAVDIGYSCRLLTEGMRVEKIKDIRTPMELTTRLTHLFDDLVPSASAINSGSGSCVSSPAQPAVANQARTPLLTHAPPTVSTAPNSTGAFNSADNQARRRQTVKEAGPLNLGLAIDGQTVSHAFESEDAKEAFLKVCLLAKAVVCCRLAPKQKAQLVRLVRDALGVITVGVGDGANDVSMIQEAHIGVGIKGKEGTQAVQASDYAIPQFRFLAPLFLVHGRMAYRRISSFVCYYFYKNVCAVSAEMFWACFTGFSGQILFPEWLTTCYNAFWTSWPCLFNYTFDLDVPERVALTTPSLYGAGPANAFFNMKVFGQWVFFGLLHGAAAFFLPAFSVQGSNSWTGLVEGLWWQGVVAFTMVIFFVTFRLSLDTIFWRRSHIGVTMGSVVFYFVCTLLIESKPFAKALPQWNLLGVVTDVLWTPKAWLVMVGGALMVCMADLAWYATRFNEFPNPLDVEMYKLRVKQPVVKDKSERQVQINV